MPPRAKRKVHRRIVHIVDPRRTSCTSTAPVGVDLHDLVVHQPARQIEVVQRLRRSSCRRSAPGSRREGEIRAIERGAAEGERRPTGRTSIRRLASMIGGVVAAHEADLQRHTGAFHGGDRPIGIVQAEGDRLLAEISLAGWSGGHDQTAWLSLAVEIATAVDRGYCRGLAADRSPGAPLNAPPTPRATAGSRPPPAPGPPRDALARFSACRAPRRPQPIAAKRTTAQPLVTSSMAIGRRSRCERPAATAICKAL